MRAADESGEAEQAEHAKARRKGFGDHQGDAGEKQRQRAILHR